MKGFMPQEDVKKIKEQYPVGTRIELDYMNELDMPSGLQGTVISVDDARQVRMNWDNGRTLSLVPDVDGFHIIREKDKIKILIIEPNKEPFTAEIDDHYTAMQKVVGGGIAYVSLHDNECHVYCNEDGANGLPSNRKMDNGDIICGTFFIYGNCNNYGDNISLTDRQIAQYTERFREPEINLSNVVRDFSYQITSVKSTDDFLNKMGIIPQSDDEIER